MLESPGREEREAHAAYARLWNAAGAEATLRRFLLGPAGTFLLSTPLFLLPQRLNLNRELRVLDVGCGLGSGLRFLANRLHFRQSPVGVDIVPEALAQAQKMSAHGPPIDFVAAAATRLPFADESFDLVLSTYVLKHLGDIAVMRFFHESWRVLRPGGMLVVWEWAPTRSRLLNRFHRRLLTMRVQSCRLRGFGDFVDLAVESPFANMEILTLRPFVFPPIPRTAFVLTKAHGRTEEPPPIVTA
jgi:SAM-dependent methyltransferase